MNNQETDRRTADVAVDEQTLRGIELPAFQAAVDAGAAVDFIDLPHRSPTVVLMAVAGDVNSDGGAVRQLVVTDGW